MAEMQRLSPSEMGRRTVRRADPERVDLCNRPAKIVSHSGEYLCLMEACSTIDIALGFLHAAPPEPRLLLQLENGLTFPIERVWTGKRRAGYRFAGEVQLDDFAVGTGTFEARPIRLKISAPAQIVDGNESSHVQLINLSRGGAQFESTAAHQLNRLVSVAIADGPQCLGEILWKDGDRFGMKFQHPLSIEELSNAALALQPLDAPFQTPLTSSFGKARAA
ncbi:PilZ domain-containing protein [Erythrobacter sp. F6033]|uniref:PilZ domain-containing protein n=1 Tax=Erythrobacter sp. F6033 TaxID=2926401 RepID=UPI001FF140B0|nr:PilZ domain-containing protein [Erythrobacter sp. F6033]MCK0129610.1 PilZ domain-containing protein [Erythrobacter sp. F6033]